MDFIEKSLGRDTRLEPITKSEMDELREEYRKINPELMGRQIISN